MVNVVSFVEGDQGSVQWGSFRCITLGAHSELSQNEAAGKDASSRNSVDCGKSVFQNLIVTPLLGGRVARPYSYMIGETNPELN